MCDIEEKLRLLFVCVESFRLTSYCKKEDVKSLETDDHSGRK